MHHVFIYELDIFISRSSTIYLVSIYSLIESTMI